MSQINFSQDIHSLTDFKRNTNQFLTRFNELFEKLDR